MVGGSHLQDQVRKQDSWAEKVSLAHSSHSGFDAFHQDSKRNSEELQLFVSRNLGKSQSQAGLKLLGMGTLLCFSTLHKSMSFEIPPNLSALQA